MKATYCSLCGRSDQHAFYCPAAGDTTPEEYADLTGSPDPGQNTTDSPTATACAFCGLHLPDHHTLCPIAQAQRTARTPALWYDYEVQCWVRDGKYLPCAHASGACHCYGRTHAGEPAGPRHYRRVQ